MALKSMTGFGAAEGAAGGGRLRIEIRTVNHRHLSVQLKAPGELSAIESDIRERLRKHFERGHATVSVRWVEEPERAAAVQVDLDRARLLVKALRAAGKKLKIKGDVTLEMVARMPEVLKTATAENEVTAADVLKIVDKAAKACVVMREREGRALVEDLLERLAILIDKTSLIRARAPERLVAEKERLKRNVQELAAGVALNQDRLAQEIAHMADKLDITEELVRFAAHVEAVRGALGNASEAVGKQLGFLLQELGRETNTIGSKANDAVIAEAVIAMKGELERMREQIENLE
jgi:uncharacterized protein (TIGR00255 family)